MGFFKDFKDDFSQALSELLPGDDFAEEDEIQVNTLDDELDVEQELSKLDGLLEQVEKKTSQLVSEATDTERPVTSTDEAEQELSKEPELETIVEPKAEKEPEPEAIVEAEAEEEPELEAIIEPEAEEEPELEVIIEAETEEELELEAIIEAETEEEPELEAIVETETEEEPELQAMLESAAEPEFEAEEPDLMSQIDAQTQVELQNIYRKDTMKEEKIMDTMDMTVTAAAEVAAEVAAETATTAAVNNEVTDEVSVITAGTSIKGNMETTGSFEIEGKIEGDIKCNGKLTVIGSVVGNSASSEFFADAAHIEGEVVSSGTVKVGLGSVIIGNITATSAVIAGAVKGDIDVQGPVVVDTSAVIMGNIKSRSVQINNGAVIEGFCSQCYSDVDVESLFSKK